MANEEQLSILKQGVEVWNRWREENPGIEIDLSQVDLYEANLPGINLGSAHLFGVQLNKANLMGADLKEADLSTAQLQYANLEVATLNSAWLSRTDFSEADLSGANLRRANLLRAILSNTQLRKAHLGGAVLRETQLSKSNFSKTIVESTVFAGLDLRDVIGFEESEYAGPSTIGTDTLFRSKGKIPGVFLRGCGLSDWEIEQAKLYDPDLSNEERNKILYRVYDLQATQPIQISPLFVSYSRADYEFVDKFGNELNKKGVRYWRDIHDMKAGRIETQIDRAIRQNPTLLLVLSEKSLKSDWVEHEVRTARALEKDLGRDILCPIALDNTWKDSRWPKRVMEQIMEYNILDFSGWEDDSKFDGMFRKLIDGLELFYKG